MASEAQRKDWIDAEIKRHLAPARARGQAAQASRVRAVAARYDAARDRIVLALSNGAEFSLPTHLAQGLAGAPAEALSRIEITPSGFGLHWPMLDTDLSVAGLLAGVFGNALWMREIASRGGKATSPAKAAAAQRTYTVVRGDTLSAIGKKFGVNWRDIAAANNIANPDLIYPGQVFVIPN